MRHHNMLESMEYIPDVTKASIDRLKWSVLRNGNPIYTVFGDVDGHGSKVPAGTMGGKVLSPQLATSTMRLGYEAGTHSPRRCTTFSPLEPRPVWLTGIRAEVSERSAREPKERR
ncbi:hypothetical protein RvY_01320 [Ramazzottius varieornatus]|uniref:Uncharacterized protein n=1 Tax=Ramazzottius varieornatus TaxID=947166 RepID=A0A1D1UJH5_RAMVA|nr:hypothetical protein RvY_01320 [Ramazzottius varieornatus]